MRFENTIKHENFRGPRNAREKGMILADNTDGQKLRKLVRKMRHFNYVPSRNDMPHMSSRNIKLEFVIEDPVFRDSSQSFLHQMVDVIAYSVRQIYEPNSYMRKKGGHRFYYRLKDVIIKDVTSGNIWGIVKR